MSDEARHIVLTILNGPRCNPFELALAIRVARGTSNRDDLDWFQSLMEDYARRLCVRPAFVERAGRSLFDVTEPTGADIAQWVRDSWDGLSGAFEGVSAVPQRPKPPTLDEIIAVAEAIVSAPISVRPATLVKPCKPPTKEDLRQVASLLRREHLKNTGAACRETHPRPAALAADEATPPAEGYYRANLPRVIESPSVDEVWRSSRPSRTALWESLGPDLVEDDDPEVPPMWCRKKTRFVNDDHVFFGIPHPGPFFDPIPDRIIQGARW